LSGGRKKTYLALKRRCRRLQWLGEARPSFSSCSPCFSFSRSVSLVSFVCLVFSLSPSLVPSLLYFFFSVFFVPCSLLVSLSSFFSPSVGSVIFCLIDPGESFVSILKGNPEGPLFFFYFRFVFFFLPFSFFPLPFIGLPAVYLPGTMIRPGTLCFSRIGAPTVPPMPDCWWRFPRRFNGVVWDERKPGTRSKLGCVFL
jgi:hypothetical protein